MLLRGRRRKRKTPVVRRGSAALKSGRNHLQQKNQGVFNKSRSYRQCIVADKTSDRLMFSLWAGSHNWVSSCGPFPIKPSIKPPIKPSAFAYGKGVLKPPKTSYFFWRSGRWQETEFPENSSLGGDFSRCGINFDVTLECVFRTKKISSSALYELTWQYL